MGRTKRKVEVAYLDADKLELLKQLAAQTRIPRSVLLREAVDDLLKKYGIIEAPVPVPHAAPVERQARRASPTARRRKSRKL